MTKKQEALRLALEALKDARTNDDSCEKWDRNKEAINAIKEALAQPAQEPVVAGVSHIDDLDLWHFYPLQETVNFPAGTKFYTTSQQRPWVGLTDEEVMQTMSGDWTSQFYFARAIEAELKEKNT